MRLYATITSERDSRPGKKGGNESLRVELSAFGKLVGQVVLEIVEDSEGRPTHYVLKFSPGSDHADGITLTEGPAHQLPVIKA